MLYKFLLLGILSTVIDYAVYASLLSVGVYYMIAIVLGYSLGFTINFFLGRKLVFIHGRKVKHLQHELLGTIAIAILGVGLNILIVYLLSFAFFDIDVLYARVCAIGIVFFWNYMMRKWFVYRSINTIKGFH